MCVCLCSVTLANDIYVESMYTLRCTTSFVHNCTTCICTLSLNTSYTNDTIIKTNQHNRYYLLCQYIFDTNVLRCFRFGLMSITDYTRVPWVLVLQHIHLFKSWKVYQCKVLGCSNINHCVINDLNISTLATIIYNLLSMASGT